MKKSIVRDKSKVFALSIINLYKNLTTNKKEYVISKQILYGVPVGPSRTLPTKQLVLFLNGSRQSVISMTVT